MVAPRVSTCVLVLVCVFCPPQQTHTHHTVLHLKTWRRRGGGGGTQTLLPERKRPLELKFPYVPSPIAFTKLFTRSRGLRMMVLVAGLQCVPEGKNISDLQQIKMMSVRRAFPSFAAHCD
jgi:hypothetical protein